MADNPVLDHIRVIHDNLSVEILAALDPVVPDSACDLWIRQRAEAVDLRALGDQESDSLPERERVELQRSVGRMLFALDHAIARTVTLAENGNPLHAIRHRYHGLSEQVVWLLEDWERTARYSEILSEYREAAVVLRTDAEESQAYMPPTEFSNLCTGITCMVDSLDRATERIAWSRAAALVHNIRPAYFALYNHVNTAIQTHVGDTQRLRQQQEEVMQLLDEAEAKVSSGI